METSFPITIHGKTEDKPLYYYRIAGYIRGVYISWISKLLRFAELISTKLIENHTHVASVATSRVQSLQKFEIFILRKFVKYTPLENNPLYDIIVMILNYNDT